MVSTLDSLCIIIVNPAGSDPVMLHPSSCVTHRIKIVFLTKINYVSTNRNSPASFNGGENL